jgi:hypothetical protein
VKAGPCLCGASMAHEVAWCLRCYRPRDPETPDSPTVSEEPDTFSFLKLPSVSAQVAEARERSRAGVGKWAATSVTYGPAGRIVGTVLVTLPVLYFLRTLLPYGFIGIVAYLVVYPRMLKDLWRRSDRL